MINKKYLFLLVTLLLLTISCARSQENIESSTDLPQYPGQISVLSTKVPSQTPNLTHTITIPQSSLGKETPTVGIPTQGSSPLPKPEGVIYLWMYGYLDPLYTKVDFSNEDLPVFIDDRMSPEPLRSSNSRMVLALSFAPYSQKIAYVTKINNVIELWLADLELKQVDLLMTDQSQWLGSIQDPGDVFIRWGPSEQSLILSSFLAEEHLIIYSIESKTELKAVGACDRVAPIVDAIQWTVWCSFQNDPPYGYFSPHGDFVSTEIPPDESVEVIEYSFSPDGQSIVYAPKQGNVSIKNGRGMDNELTIRLLSESSGYRTQSFLQWLPQRERLFAKAYAPGYCPLRENPVSGALEEKNCWLIVDIQTSEIVWWPELIADEVGKLTGFSLEESFFPCAGLSSDGDWLGFCIQSGAIKYFLLTEVDNPEILLDFGSSNFMDFKWLGKE